MTGYGRHELSSDRYHVTAELRSYNSRYLEVNVSVPPTLGELEQRVRQKIDGELARGRVEAHLRVVDADEAVEIEVNEPLARAYRRALEELAGATGQAVTLDHLLSVGGLLRERRPQDVEAVWAEAEAVVDAALAQLVAARQAEGESAAADVRAQLSQLTAELDLIQRDTATEEAAAGAMARAHDAAARARELLASDADDARVATALATLLARADINEELVRARGHLVAFEAALGEDSTGKHMEFLCQEILREVNTIAAKSADYGVAAAAVRAKGCLERMREHLRNVE